MKEDRNSNYQTFSINYFESIINDLVSTFSSSYNDIEDSPFGSDGVLASVFCFLKQKLKKFVPELCENKNFLSFFFEFNKIKIPYEDQLGVMTFFECYPSEMNKLYSFLNKSKKYKDNEIKEFIGQIQKYVELYNKKKNQENKKNIKYCSTMNKIKEGLNFIYCVAKKDLKNKNIKSKMVSVFDSLKLYAELDTSKERKLKKINKQRIKKGLIAWYEKYKNTDTKNPDKVKEAILAINDFQFKLFSSRSRLGQLKNIVKKLNSLFKNKKN